MDFDGFDWDDGNRDKCRKHGASLSEIESLFSGQPLVGPDLANSLAEQRFRAAGTTAEGRALFVVFTWRTKGGGTLIRPISARYMHRREIETYENQISRF